MGQLYALRVCIVHYQSMQKKVSAVQEDTYSFHISIGRHDGNLTLLEIAKFQLWVFMVYSSYPLSIVLKSFQGNYWLFYIQWYNSFVESFLFRQARWKIIQTQQIYQNIFQWSATTSLFLWSMCLQLAEGFSFVYTTVTALAASLLCSGLLGK